MTTLLRLSGPLIKLLQQVVQDQLQSGFNVSKDGDSTTFLDNLFQHLTTLSVKKIFLFCLNWKFLYFTLCSLSLVLSQGTTKKPWAPSSLLTSIRCLYTCVRSPSSFLFLRLSDISFRYLSLSLYVRCSHFSIIFVALNKNFNLDMLELKHVISLATSGSTFCLKQQLQFYVLPE